MERLNPEICIYEINIKTQDLDNAMYISNRTLYDTTICEAEGWMSFL